MQANKWDKYQLKVSIQAKKKQYLDHLIDPSFQGAARLLVLLWKVNAVRAEHTRYFPPKVEKKKRLQDYNAVIDGCNLLHYQLVKNDLITYCNIRKKTEGQWDDYTTGCLLDYPYVKENYKMIAIDLSKR